MNAAAPPPMLLSVAPNGARRTKADHPALPVTAPEIAATAAACCEAGAGLIHLHVRDKDGRHTLDGDAYREAIAAIRAEVGDRLIVQATTEAVGIYTPEQQMAMVRDVRPEAVSLALRELIPDAGHEKPAAEFFAWLRRERIIPQYILFSADEVVWFKDLRRRGIVPDDKVFVLYVLGRYTKGQVSTPTDLLPFLAVEGARDWFWGLCAFGASEGACALAAAALGGHPRVGFENNWLLSDGSFAPDNAALVTQVADGARLLGRPLADASTARELLA
jgi:uncharacterized protein (DUF849 family)